MIDDIIAKPGFSHCYPHHDYRDLHHLFKENYLSEFQTEHEREIVRRNLDVISKMELPKEVLRTVQYGILDGTLDVSDPNLNTKLKAYLDEIGIGRELVRQVDRVEFDLEKFKVDSSDRADKAEQKMEENLETALKAVDDSKTALESKMEVELFDTKEYINRQLADQTDKVNEAISGVGDGIDDKLDALTKDVDDKLEHFADNLPERTIFLDEDAVWVPSGPVLTTVGFIEDNTNFVEEKYTLQEIMDLLFYGNRTSSETDVFVGIIDDLDKKISYPYLQSLVEDDPENNEFVYFNSTIEKEYDFEIKKAGDLKYLTIAVPDHYIPLHRMSLNSQSFSLDAFEVREFDYWNGEDYDDENNPIYTHFNVFIYKQGLASLSSPILFKF